VKVRLSGPARADLKNAFDFIHADNPRAAQAVVETILTRLRTLETTPNRGRSGRITGTRELVVSRTGHVAAYVVREDEVIIVRIRHGRQHWP
jgi:addiction module RelE/StbE family toxin